ncbi:MAG TPA: ROK family transcriptional regulator [Candidatus Limnocylindrales bacterium]|jgi:predicted NBD/HSP70 family sugar kinase|nr:ROK family transcriptional regulator [Candidatus Limnocylindrales bacterium]
MLIGRDELGHRSETVRRANLSAIVRELHESGPLSRSDLVARTGLTRSAIRGLIGELVAGGLATEGPAPLDGTPGRPSPVVRTDPHGAVVIALEIAVDSLAAATVGLGGRVIDLVRIDLPRGRSSVDDIAIALAGLASSVRDRLPSDDTTVGVGVAVVGVVRRSDGMVSLAPNLGWRDEPLGQRLAKELDVDVPITLANEADLAALAEHRRGVARGIDDIVLIWGSVGVGGGLVVDGEPLTGSAGYSGEIGHIPVNPDGIPCRCGSIGCLETEVGSTALLRRAGRSPEGGHDAVDEVLAAAEAGEPGALAAFAETGRWLGIGLAGVINILNPELVLLGGRLTASYAFVRASLEAELDRRVLRAARGIVRVVPASLGVDAPLRGAAELAFEPLLSDPAAWLRPRQPMVVLATA